MAYKCLEGVDVVCRCGRPAAVHHIVKRGSAEFLKECRYNMAFLCGEHHREVHRYAEKDEELKREMQQRLEVLFKSNYYTREDIKDILDIKNKDVDQLCKLLKWHQEGYRREDIIFRCMGGKNYL